MKPLALAALALVASAVTGCAAASSDDVGEAATEVKAGRVTLANWETHPKIVAVRDLVNEIDATKKYEAESKTDLCAESGHGEMERTKVTDQHGVIRELVLSFGSEDSTEIASHYYDAKGRLRFVFTTRNDVHGNADELQTYFDETGERVWDVRRHASSKDTSLADLEHAPYEAVAAQKTAKLDPAVLTPADRYEAPEQCD